MQGGSHAVEMGRGIEALGIEPVGRYVYTGKGEAHRRMSAFRHVVNALGLCAFGIRSADASKVADDLNAVTGWDYTVADLLEIGDRIATIRHAFNVREGLNPAEFEVPGRLIGSPPLEEGPLAGVEIDLSAQIEDYFRAMDWDIATAKPSKKRLIELGLEDVAKVLWP
jgi:aldehyde:ferredoxin oxidoreductase